MTSCRFKTAVILVLFLSVAACKGPVEQPSGKIRILTTIAPLYSFTKNIAGDAALVDNLIPSGVGPHEYSLSPNDARKVSEAQILIVNGVNLEAWLHKLTGPDEDSRKSAPDEKGKPVIVNTSIGIDIISNDPHIWLSPKNAVIQVKNIRDALIKSDAANAETYSQNAAEYIRRLEILDREIKAEVSVWKKKEFVAFHPAFEYFARDYGLKQAAVIQQTPEIEPSPQHIAHVIETIKSKGIKAIFTEPQFSHKIVSSIARDLNLQVYSLDTLETGAFSKGWYEETMRANVKILKKVLE